MTSSTATTTTSSTLPPDWAPPVEKLRLAHVGRADVDVDAIDVGRPRIDAADSLVVDAHNGLVDVDARLSLAAIARALHARGWRLPLFRPLPSTPLWRLAPRAAFVVDALVQRATLLSVDGDLLDTPPAPRHSAGPSLLHGTTMPAPLAVLVRARLRIVSSAHTVAWHEAFAHTDDVAHRVREFVDGARAFALCAHGTSLWVLGGSALAPPSSTTPRAAETSTTATTSSTALMGLRWASARSLRPGDAGGIASALRAGRRVVAVPYLQRTAVLERDRPARRLVDVHSAAAALANALSSAPANAPVTVRARDPRGNR
jgi:hypothetical protein